MLQWVDDSKGNQVCDVGLLRLAAYASPTTGEACYRIVVKRGDDWDQLVWGSSRSRAASMQDAETVAREVVLRGLLSDDGSADAMLTRLALFAPVTGAELELLIRRTREWAEATCREVAEAEIEKAVNLVIHATAKSIAPAVKREVKAALRSQWRWWPELAVFCVGMVATAIAWMVTP